MTTLSNILEAPDGLRWISGSENHWSDARLAYTGHEDWLTPILFNLLPRDGVFVDVGAHVGTWAVRAAKFRQATVYAYEPTRTTRNILTANLALNDLLDKVHVKTSIAWNTEGEVFAMVADPSQVEGHAMVNTEPSWGDEAVQTTRLDLDLMGAEVDVVKIDVEGAEAQVVEGMEGLMASSHRPRGVIVEMHHRLADINDPSIPKRIKAVAKRVDYVVTPVRENEEIPYWVLRPRETIQDEGLVGSR